MREFSGLPGDEEQDQPDWPTIMAPDTPLTRPPSHYSGGRHEDSYAFEPLDSPDNPSFAATVVPESGPLTGHDSSDIEIEEGLGRDSNGGETLDTGAARDVRDGVVPEPDEATLNPLPERQDKTPNPTPHSDEVRQSVEPEVRAVRPEPGEARGGQEGEAGDAVAPEPDEATLNPVPERQDEAPDPTPHADEVMTKPRYDEPLAETTLSARITTDGIDGPERERASDRPLSEMSEMSEGALAEVARDLFDRIFAGDWQGRAVTDRLSLEEQYEVLRREIAAEERVGTFRFTLPDGRQVLIVTRDDGHNEKTLGRVARGLLVEALWKTVDIYVGVPVSMVLNPPTDLLQAVLYAPSLAGR